MNGMKKQVRIQKGISRSRLPMTLTAVGSIPRVNNPKALSTSSVRKIRATATIPQFAQGSSVVAMSQMMQGRRLQDTSFPKAFSSSGNLTSQGGFYVPGARRG